jgi:hypothetical protein
MLTSPRSDKWRPLGALAALLVGSELFFQGSETTPIKWGALGLLAIGTVLLGVTIAGRDRFVAGVAVTAVFSAYLFISAWRFPGLVKDRASEDLVGPLGLAVKGAIGLAAIAGLLGLGVFSLRRWSRPAQAD